MNLRIIILTLIFLYVKEFYCQTLEQCERENNCEYLTAKVPPGDPQHCPQTANILGVLPGHGWDNLRNKPMASVLYHNFSFCRMTLDRKFIIPNNVDVVARKETNMHVYSQIINNTSEQQSSSSKSINVETPGALAKFHNISGTFSDDYNSNKERIMIDQTTLSRSQMRYKRYEIISRPDTKLDRVFEDRIMDIISCIQLSNNKCVRYLSEVLVRDYGTHYVKSLGAGAWIEKNDFLSSDYVKSTKTSENKIRAAARATFLEETFNLSVSFASTTIKTDMTNYINGITDSYTRIAGGPSVRMQFDIDDWIADIDTNLVAIDRGGEPIYELITSRALPYASLEDIISTATAIEEAVVTYYENNAYRGCTNVESPNFSYIANLEDGTCTESRSEYGFGGIYQTCTGEICNNKFIQKNPKTGDFSCEKEYTSVSMFTYKNMESKDDCKYKYDLRHKKQCGIKYTGRTAEYHAYWCAKAGQATSSSGYLFGGFYTDTVVNPMTNDKTCPIYFTPLQFGFTVPITICVSDDYQLGSRRSLTFGGFFSCITGNPLALLKEVSSTRSKTKTQEISSNQDDWPKRCPSGYSQHFIVNSDDCGINYCASTNEFVQHILPIIQRPPFLKRPSKMYNGTRVLVDDGNDLWVKASGDLFWQKTDVDDNAKSSSDDHDHGVSKKVVAVISVWAAVATLVCLLFLVKCACDRCRKPQRANAEKLRLLGENNPQ